MIDDKHVIIFARAPHYGRVKRRLARDIGMLQACNFYRRNLINLIAEMRTTQWQLHIAVASASDARHPAFSGMSTMVQPHGDLGYRMRSALQHFRHCRRVLIGSDIPGISRTLVQQSFTSLAHHDVVFGPAFDGGFWLVGCGAAQEPTWRFMRNVRWSTRFALVDSLATVSSGSRIGQMPGLGDVDDGQSYRQAFGLDSATQCKKGGLLTQI